LLDSLLQEKSYRFEVGCVYKQQQSGVAFIIGD